MELHRVESGLRSGCARVVGVVGRRQGRSDDCTRGMDGRPRHRMCCCESRTDLPLPQVPPPTTTHLYLHHHNHHRHHYDYDYDYSTACEPSALRAVCESILPGLNYTLYDYTTLYTTLLHYIRLPYACEPSALRVVCVRVSPSALETVTCERQVV